MSSSAGSVWPAVGSALVAGAFAARVFLKGAIQTQPTAAAPPKPKPDELELTEELLYYGSIVTRFDVVKGSAYAYDAKSFAESGDRKSSDSDVARARYKPASFLGAEYVNVCVPAIPATDVIVKDKPAAAAAASKSWPDAIAKPLLKSRNGKIIGVGSGVRSALIKASNGKWYRLKGCGNLNSGFPFAIVSPLTPYVNVRGSSFEHTTARELYMTELVHEKLSAHGLVGANRAVGWYEYDLPRTQLPKIVRTCVVLETCGNKRVGDHILTGLERLLPELIDAKRFDFTALRKRWPAARSADSGGSGRPQPTWTLAMAEQHSDYADFVNYYLPETIPQFPEKAAAGWKPIWDKNVALLRAFFPSSETRDGSSGGAKLGSLLAYVYWRIGREVGAAQRILRDADISWGTYVDEMGTHCNAHSNNLVLMAEGKPGSSWLSLLDLDMAYTRKSFLFEKSADAKSDTKSDTKSDSKSDSGADAARDDAKMNNWLELEVMGMRMALAGDDQISTGVTATAVLNDDFTDLKWALRDTLMAGFESAFNKQPDAHPINPAIHSQSYALLKLSLIATTLELA